MSFVNLTDSNILLYAAKCYDKPNCLDSEFDEDYKRIRYIKRLLHRYRISGVLKERLILNHIIVAQNVFGIEASVRMLFCKIDPRDYSALKTFLAYISAMPNVIYGIDGNNISSKDIPLDSKIMDVLNKI
jgi:hypothetical protein